MEKNYKRCPRCGQKTNLSAKVCLDCGLKFDRVKNLSNIEAKKAIKNKEKERILHVTQMPNDISKKKFFLLYFLLGFFGAHNIYIGNFKRGFYALITVTFYLVMFTLDLILLSNNLDTSMFEYIIVAPLSTFSVFAIIMWFTELVALITHTFKYPATMSNEDYINYVVQASAKNDKNKKDVENKKLKKKSK